MYFKQHLASSWKKVSSLVFFTLLVFFLGFVAGSKLEKTTEVIVAQTQPTGVLREGDISEFRYIHPLLTYESPESNHISEFAQIENELTKFADQKKLNGEANQLSIYFRDFASARWIVLNEEQRYTPASLLKVPIMIAYYKLVEEQPDILEKQILFNQALDINEIQYHVPSEKIELGKSYSVEELIRSMIVYSDNNATILLIQNIEDRIVREVFTDLGLSIPKDANAVDFMTVKQYSYFFRVLRNATYLSRAYSEKALQMLVEVDYPNGIAASIPEGIPVAQKYGERSQPLAQQDAGETKELHDCGIVYYPNRPYMLCIMSQGKSFETLEKIIQDISKMVYELVDYEYKNKWILNVGNPGGL